LFSPTNYDSFSPSEVNEEVLQYTDVNEKNNNVVDASTSTVTIQQRQQQPKRIETEIDFEQEARQSTTIPVFYNLFIKETADMLRVKGIVAEQFAELLPVHKPIYVNSIGVPLDFNEQDTEHNIFALNTTRNPVELLGHHKTASESVSLKAIWDYCNIPENKYQKVAYLHSKGSFTATSSNEMLRRFLTTSTLSQECANMPMDTCNICTGRFSPVPHPHNSGNMWVASCRYIKKLIDPDKFQEAMDGLGYGGGDIFLACDGRNRYSAEHWVHSHPSVKPCDLYNDPGFTWGYDGMPTKKEFQENKSLKAAPRFKLETYIKTNVGYCRGRGASKKWRIDEYRSLYNEEPPSDWWGHGILKNNENWWPYKDYGWVEQTMESREELIKLGWNFHLWTQPRSRPYPLWGKEWNQLSYKQRTVLTDVFVYDKDSWDAETRKEVRDALRIQDTVDKFEPNFSHDHCSLNNVNKKINKVEPWYPRKPENQGRSLKSFVYEAASKPANKRRVLLIASAPTSETRLVTLWSELECFTEAVDHVIITAPTWAEPYVEHVMKIARQLIPHFLSGQVTMESKYFVNNRYDVGLWCDAYNSLKRGSYDEYGMINDSVLALRKFSAIFDNLDYRKAMMSSINYSYTGKWNKDFGPHNWYAVSIFRAFTNEGIEVFKDYSCVPEDDPKFCPERENNKDCIINNFEIDLIKAYPCNKVTGLYPADSMGQLIRRDPTKRIWIKDTRYWRLLVDHMGFPILKSNESEQFGQQFVLSENIPFWKNNPLMKTCTSLILDRLELLFDTNLPSFKTAKPYIKREWVELPQDLQQLAETKLGFDIETWNQKQYSPLLDGKKWNDLSGSKQAALMRLECSKLNFNMNRCFEAR